MEFADTLQYVFGRAVYFFVPVLISSLAVCALAIIARYVGLVDVPTSRKQHSGETPLVGGIAIFIAFCIVHALFALNHSNTIPFLLLASILMIIGVVDDYSQISSKLRLLIQTGIALGMIYLTGIEINNIGNLFGYGPVHLTTAVGILFTVFCTIGIVNSINMVDGVDGLAGTIVLISLSALCLLAWISDNLVEALMLLKLCACIMGFLLFNTRLIFKKAYVFLGDAGSMLLGFMLLWFFLKLSQDNPQSLSAVGAGWIFGLPLIDTISVMMRRIFSGNSPFEADRSHLHHRLLNSNMSVNRTVITMTLLHSVLVLGGIFVSLKSSFEPIMFWSFVLLILFYHYFIGKYFPLTKDNIFKFKKKMKARIF